MTDLWTEASRDVLAERRSEATRRAGLALAPKLAFVMGASSRDEFEDRLALVAAEVQSVVGAATVGDPTLFPLVHEAVLSDWSRSFDELMDLRSITSQRRNNRRGYERQVARDKQVRVEAASEVCGCHAFEGMPGAKVPCKQCRDGWPCAECNPGASLPVGQHKASRKTADRVSMKSPTESEIDKFIGVAQAIGYTISSDEAHDIIVLNGGFKEAMDSANIRSEVYNDVRGYGGLAPEDGYGISTLIEATSGGDFLLSGRYAITGNWDDMDSPISYADAKKVLDLLRTPAKRQSLEREMQRRGLTASRKVAGDDAYYDGLPADSSDFYYDFGKDHRDPDGDHRGDNGDYPFNVTMSCPTHGQKTITITRGDQTPLCPECGRRMANRKRSSFPSAPPQLVMAYQHMMQYGYAGGKFARFASRKTAGTPHPSGTAFGWPRSADGHIACPSCGASNVTLTGSNLGSDVVRGNMWTGIRCKDCGASSGAPLQFTDRNGADTETLWDKQWGWKGASRKQAGPMFPGAGAQVYYNDAGEPTGWDEGGDEGDFDPNDDSYSEVGDEWEDRMDRESSAQTRLISSSETRHLASTVVVHGGTAHWAVTSIDGEREFASGVHDSPEVAARLASALASRMESKYVWVDDDDDKKAPVTPEAAPDAAPQEPVKGAVPPPQDDAQVAPPPAAEDGAPKDIAPSTPVEPGPTSGAPVTQDGVVEEEPSEDPSMMDVGQATTMSYVMAGGGSGSVEVTFVREDNGIFYFNGPTGEFGVAQREGKWIDAAANEFTFGASTGEDSGGEGQTSSGQNPAPQDAPPPEGTSSEAAPPSKDGESKSEDSAAEPKTDKDDESKPEEKDEKKGPPWKKEEK